MTLSEIIALPDAELYAAFYRTAGIEPKYWDTRIDTGEVVSIEGWCFEESTACDWFSTEAEAWANAPAPEPDVWLKVMDELPIYHERECYITICSRVSVLLYEHGLTYRITAKNNSAALMRSVLACYIYTHQPEQK